MVDTIRLKPKKNSAGTTKITSKESSGFLKFLFLTWALWIPYWLWAESSIPVSVKYAIRNFLGEDCADSGLKSSTSDISPCTTAQIELVSANVGVLTSNIFTEVAASKMEASRPRYFRIQYSWKKEKWVVAKEISAGEYYLAY